MAKTIITAALTGAVTPAGYDIPETPEQIAKCAYECWQAGASVVHLHMRDDNGAGVMDPVKFYETVKAIRAYKDCDVIVNCTSSGDNRVSDDSPYGNAMRMLHHKIWAPCTWRRTSSPSSRSLTSALCGLWASTGRRAS